MRRDFGSLVSVFCFAATLLLSGQDVFRYGSAVREHERKRAGKAFKDDTRTVRYGWA